MHRLKWVNSWEMRDKEIGEEEGTLSVGTSGKEKGQHVRVKLHSIMLTRRKNL